MKSAKVADSVCKMCSHRTQGFDSYIYAVQNVSLDCSKGWYQSLQNIFSADLRRTLPCAQVACKAPQGQVLQEQFLLWPLALTLFFQQVPVSPAAQYNPSHVPAEL